MKEPNLVKDTCKEFSLTYRQLGEEIGYREKTLSKVASSGIISIAIKKAVEMYVENRHLKKQLDDLDYLKSTLKKFLS